MNKSEKSMLLTDTYGHLKGVLK